MTSGKHAGTSCTATEAIPGGLSDGCSPPGKKGAIADAVGGRDGKSANAEAIARREMAPLTIALDARTARQRTSSLRFQPGRRRWSPTWLLLVAFKVTAEAAVHFSNAHSIKPAVPMLGPRRGSLMHLWPHSRAGRFRLGGGDQPGRMQKRAKVERATRDLGNH